MYRHELGYRIAAFLVLLGAPFAPFLYSFSKDGPPEWMSEQLFMVLSYIIFGYLIAAFVLAVYQTLDPKETWKCSGCDFKEIVPGKPWGFWFKFIVFGYGGIVVLLALVGLAAWLISIT